MIVSKGRICAREGKELIKYYKSNGLVVDIVSGCFLDNYIIKLGDKFLVMLEIFLTNHSSEYELLECDDIELVNDILN